MGLTREQLTSINGKDAVAQLDEVRAARDKFNTLRSRALIGGLGSVADRGAGIINHQAAERKHDEAMKSATDEFEAVAYPLRHEAVFHIPTVSKDEEVTLH